MAELGVYEQRLAESGLRVFAFTIHKRLFKFEQKPILRAVSGRKLLHNLTSLRRKATLKIGILVKILNLNFLSYNLVSKYHQATFFPTLHIHETANG